MCTNFFLFINPMKKQITTNYTLSSFVPINNNYFNAFAHTMLSSESPIKHF